MSTTETQKPTKTADVIDLIARRVQRGYDEAKAQVERDRFERNVWRRRLHTLDLPARIEYYMIYCSDRVGRDINIKNKGPIVPLREAYYLANPPPTIISLHGRTGTGKSVAAAIWLSYFDYGVEGSSGLWVAAPDFALWTPWSDNARRCTSVAALVLDDVGLEPERGIPRVESLIYERFAAALPTVLTTNLTPPSFRERYNERVWSRIGEDGATIICRKVLRPRREDDG